MPKGVYLKPTPIQRLLSKIKYVGECWVWSGYSKNRYGSIKVGNKYEKTHRFSYSYYVGPIPVGMYVCHTCDNGLCVNPKHLFLGTQFDNMQDMKVKGRERKAIGSAAGRSVLTTEQVLSIRKELALGNTCWQVAKKYNVKYNTIRYIKLGLSWRHV